jgi:hypothetical protein
LVPDPGDRLLAANGARILSASDLSFVLQELPKGATELSLTYLRAGEERTARVELTADWKRGTPLSFSWRPFKWELLPKPGFGGKALADSEKRALELDPDRFAFRVTYIVDWGDHPRYGREALRAGLRMGDVVVGVAGKDDFVSEAHFHSWWRLTRSVDETVEVEYLRGGERRTAKIRTLR